jgi:phenylacetate-CoA ligase
MSQLEKLRALLAAIVPGNRFYTKRLAADGVTALNLVSVDDFTKRVSFTHKQELAIDQATHPPYGSNLTFPTGHYSRVSQTTGTTGRPIHWLDTAESWEWMLGHWDRIYRAAEIGAGDRLYFAFSFGPFLGFWTAFEGATKLGCLCLPGGGLGSTGRLRAMIHHRATVLCCTPTYALHLAETAAGEAIDLGESAIRKIIVAGEPGGSVPQVRERISAAWKGARVFDHYGMTEVGPVAFQTADREGVLHVIEDSYLAEIIEPGGAAPVAPGGVGELVLTTLGRTGSPLLRYRTGDLVKRSADAPGFALEGGIIGRADDMIVVRGVNLYPSAVDAVVRSVPGIIEYRVEVSRRGAMTEVELKIETADDAAAGKLERALAAAFSLRIPVTRIAANSLPRFEMKARRWITAE